ncbi:tyrosine-protein phosphatase non-receptor type 1 isoform X2 [Salmo salar]|uniref:Tyrosine-protein phosphatase non-receptor type n=1 Tax=Salmo salar TaxID=8030 RepID=A0ABM3E8D2_SALSA|nr:tyrosine-protein phosphatase non-receptor type 1 isoform X2 [Salmo salar]
MDQQFEEIDSSGQWQNLYNKMWTNTQQEIRSQASDYSYQMAKRPENQNRNRYRDVSPYDHSRVKLENSENDYINASLVMVEEAQRIYILSQGPLKNTCGHFWLMVWEQNSKAVIMLNRIIEKGSEKCAQYWPTAEGHQLSYTDTGFVVTLVKEEDMSYYVIRVLELRNTEMDKRKDPSSVDIQKVLLDMREYRMGLIQTPDQLRFSYRAVLEGAKSIMGDCSVQSQWRELSREDRATVCQSPPAPPPRSLSDAPAPPLPPPRPLDAPPLLYPPPRPSDAPAPPLPPPRPSDAPAPPLPPPRPLDAPTSPSWPSEKPNGQPLPCVEPEAVALSREDRTSGDGTDPDSSEKDLAEVPSLRKRHRKERIASTAQKLHLMKQRLTDTERQRERWLYWRPILLNIGAGAAVALGLVVVWLFSQ